MKRERPKVLEGTTSKVVVGCGRNLYVIINGNNGSPFEVIAEMGKSGGCINCFTQSLGRLASLALRCGADAGDVVDKLEGLRCPMELPNGPLSCPDAVGQALKGRMK